MIYKSFINTCFSRFAAGRSTKHQKRPCPPNRKHKLAPKKKNFSGVEVEINVEIWLMPMRIKNILFSSVTAAEKTKILREVMEMNSVSSIQKMSWHTMWKEKNIANVLLIHRVSILSWEGKLFKTEQMPRQAVSTYKPNFIIPLPKKKKKIIIVSKYP